MRYVLFNDKYGIYLGNENWTLHPLPRCPLPAGAPTFAEDSVIRALKSLPNDGGTKLVPVVPDMPGHLASPERCANAALPRWEVGSGETVEVKNIQPKPQTSAERRSGKAKKKVGGTRVFDHKHGTTSQQGGLPVHTSFAPEPSGGVEECDNEEVDQEYGSNEPTTAAPTEITGQNCEIRDEPTPKKKRK